MSVVGFVEVGVVAFTSIQQTMNDVSERLENMVQKTDVRRSESIQAFILRTAIVVALGVILISLVIYLSLSLLIIRPLLALSWIAHQLADFDLTVNVVTKRKDEIGRLFRDINEMVRSFRRVVIQVQHCGSFAVQ